MANRLAVTGVCLVLYLAAPLLPLPGLDLAVLGTFPIYNSLGRASVFALDLIPFLAGFLLAELFSFTVPPGRRWRHDGVRGRRKLNVLGLGLGNGFAVLFAGAALRELVAWLLPTPEGARHAEPEEQIMGLALTALLVAGAAAFLLRRPQARLTTVEGGSLPYRLPPLPQGILPISWTYWLLGLLTQPL